MAIPHVENLIFVGGEWRVGRGEAVASIDPSDGSEIMTLHQASLDDVAEAVAAGEVAMQDPSWRSMLPHVRARLLYRIGEAIEADADALSALQTRDTGKTLAETKALALSAAGTFRFYAAALETLEDELTPPRGPFITMSVHEPIGVVGAIAPWNSPIASDAQKIAPALAAGAAVVLKPAEWTPLVSLRLARICEAAGLPKGLLSVLPGPGPTVGEAIVRHPKIRKVSFTGGTETGRRIAAAAAEKLMPVSLELGGKSPTIIFEDADLDIALPGIMYGVFSSTGQSCIAGARLFVPRSRQQEITDRLVELTRGLRVGPPTQAGVQVAPMVSFAHRERVAAHVDRARAAGARILCGGGPPKDPAFASGAYYLPTIVDGVDNDAAICRDEVFGPVLVILPYTDQAELIALANDTVYGLACGIWTRDYRRAYAVARAVDAGTIYVNTYKQFSISTPFGGFKDSGLGREKGRMGIRGYMQQKSIFWGLDDEPIAWAR
jgi:betaine-aldehyde dehydrogenase